HLCFAHDSQRAAPFYQMGKLVEWQYLTMSPTFFGVTKAGWKNPVSGCQAEVGERLGFRYAVDIVTFPRVTIMASIRNILLYRI
ncbi:MAG: hypothetical protein KAT27_09630, partial [Desulfobacterales bacterium]|nr:hypothetical protein [Desulfobacterales bacterium]